MFILLNVSYVFPVFNTTSLIWIMFFTNDNTKMNEFKVNLPAYIGYLEKEKKTSMAIGPKASTGCFAFAANIIDGLRNVPRLYAPCAAELEKPCCCL